MKTFTKSLIAVVVAVSSFSAFADINDGAHGFDNAVSSRSPAFSYGNEHSANFSKESDKRASGSAMKDQATEQQGRQMAADAVAAQTQAAAAVNMVSRPAPQMEKGMVHAVSTPAAAPAASTPAAPAAAPSVKAVNEGTPSQTGSINVSASSLAPSTPVSVDGKVTTAGALAPETQVAVPHSPALIASHNGGNHDRARSESRSGSNGRGSDNAHSHAFGGHGYGHDNSRSEGFGGHSHFH
ncbi:hypothetical protein CTA21_16485 [Salmonella enterica]|nr:hypothetical protein [Salmonella enterica]